MPRDRAAVRPARPAVGRPYYGGHGAGVHRLRPPHPGGQPRVLRRPGRNRRARRALAHQRVPAARPAPGRVADPAAQPSVRRHGRRHAGLVRYPAPGGGRRAAMDSDCRAVLLRPGERADKGPKGAGRAVRLAGLDSAQDRHCAADKPGYHPGPAARFPAKAPFHPEPAPVGRRRPAAAVPPAGERRHQRAGPVPRPCVPARYHKLLIYPFGRRAPDPRARTSEIPGAPRGFTRGVTARPQPAGGTIREGAT